jgi:hypothetical protein
MGHVRTRDTVGAVLSMNLRKFVSMRSLDLETVLEMLQHSTGMRNTALAGKNCIWYCVPGERCSRH